MKIYGTEWREMRVFILYTSVFHFDGKIEQYTLGSGGSKIVSNKIKYEEEESSH